MLLEARGLVKRFGGLVAVNRVDLSAAPGEILGLIGPNGSGKTTVFNLITGFLRPDGGTVRLDGRDVSGAPPHRVARLGIARTFQHVKPFAGLSVLQNVAVAAQYGHGPVHGPADVTRRCCAALDLVDLVADADAPAAALPLVKRKRLELARALAANPRLLLLDELMAGLTPAEQNEMVSQIRRIRDGGITIVMVEHIIRVVSALCDRVVVLNTGEIIAAGAPQDALRDPRVVEAYLGEVQHA